MLLASGDTAAIAKAVRSTLRAWKRSLRFIHYQEAFAFGEQLDRLLDSVEDGASWADRTKRRIQHGKGSVALVNDERGATLTDKPNAGKRKG